MLAGTRSEKIRVYLNEYNILLQNTAYLPYSTGLLQAFAQTHAAIRNAYDFAPILYARGRPAEILAAYENPVVAAFSAAIWNERLSLLVAKQVKDRFPDCVIVVGGPSAPFDATGYLAGHSFVDVVIRGEGERPFAAVLERLLETKDLSGIPGVSYRQPKTGECVNNPFAAGKHDINDFPSPYLEGVFEPLIGKGWQWQAILENSRGCPFRCSYCFWGQGGLSRKVRHFNLDRIRAEIEWCGKNRIAYVFCADGNFGMYERDLEIAQYLVETKKEYGFPDRYRVNYAKNTDARVVRVAGVLHQHKLDKAITMSLQSFNEDALSNVRRKNIKMSTFHELQKMFRDEDLSTYTELILGLPGETYDSWIAGLETCMRNGINNDIFVYLLQIYPNTELASPEYQERYKIAAVTIPLNEGHGAVRSRDVPSEYEHVVVGTYSLPTEQWKRAVVVSWMMQAMIGLKLAYFVVLYLADRFKLHYMDLVQHVASGGAGCHGFIGENISFLHDLASAILAGKARTGVLEEFGTVYWEPEELLYLRISNGRDKFYSELFEVVTGFLSSSGIEYDREEIDEVVRYQKVRVPSHASGGVQTVCFGRNLPDYFERYFGERRPELKKSPAVLTVNPPRDYRGDKKAFAEDVILFGRKSGRMLWPGTWESGKGQSA